MGDLTPIPHLPSLDQFEGGTLLWLLIGDGSRTSAKYGIRAYRFALLEAGHLMQNLCLLSTAHGFCSLPLGGFCEDAIARALALPPKDWVLYAGALGKVPRHL